jgi:hypothetical protein
MDGNIEIKIYKTIILTVILYRWKTWSLSFMEEYTLGVSEKNVLGQEGIKQ